MTIFYIYLRSIKPKKDIFLHLKRFLMTFSLLYDSYFLQRFLKHRVGGPIHSNVSPGSGHCRGRGHVENI